VANFNRSRYFNGAGGSGQGDGAHAVAWWWSEPDGAAFPHQMNLYGFRDREWRVETDHGVERVLFLGDSFVEGFGAAQSDTIPRRFEDFLRGRRVEVMNLGAGGFGWEEYLLAMPSRRRLWSAVSRHQIAEPAVGFGAKRDRM
jgi:hypothetical protein